DPATVELDEIPNIDKPEMVPIVWAIRQVAWLYHNFLLVSGTAPGARGPVHPPIDRHGPPDGRFTGQVGTILLFEEPMQPKAPRARVLLLQVQHVFEKWERQLVVGMGDGASPVVLKAFKPIALKGRKDRIYV